MAADTPELKLDVAAALDRAGKLFMERISIWLIAGMIVFIALAIVAGVSVIVSRIPVIGPLIGLVLSLGASAVVSVLFYGLLGMACDAMRGQKPELEGLFKGFGPALFPVAVASVVIGVFSWIGLMLCVIPGLFVGAIYLHTWLFIVKGERDFWAAMESSRKLVMDDLAPWLIVFAVVLCLNLVGAAVCGIGLIAAIPFIALFLAAVYERAGLTDSAPATEEFTEVPPSPAE